MTSVSSLKEQIICRYLFDDGFDLGENEGLPGIEDVITGCLDAIYSANGVSREQSDREWGVPPEATPLQKIRLAFRSVTGEGSPDIAKVQREGISAHYRNLKNEKLRESRLSFWEALPGSKVGSDEWENLSGNEVEERFHSWLIEHPESLRIKTLAMEHTLLKYLPPEIGMFKSLEEIKINFTGLEKLPPEIGQLTSLKKLDLSNNGLKKLPSEIGHLTSLEQLGLSYNSLEKLPSEIGLLESLKVLRLTKNNLEKGLPREIGYLTQLDHLVVPQKLFNSLPSEVQAMGSDLKLSRAVLDRLIEIGLLDKPSPHIKFQKEGGREL